MYDPLSNWRGYISQRWINCLAKISTAGESSRSEGSLSLGLMPFPAYQILAARLYQLPNSSVQSALAESIYKLQRRRRFHVLLAPVTEGSEDVTGASRRVRRTRPPTPSEVGSPRSVADGRSEAPQRATIVKRGSTPGSLACVFKRSEEKETHGAAWVVGVVFRERRDVKPTRRPGLSERGVCGEVAFCPLWQKRTRRTASPRQASSSDLRLSARCAQAQEKE